MDLNPVNFRGTFSLYNGYVKLSLQLTSITAFVFLYIFHHLSVCAGILICVCACACQHCFNYK